MGLGWYGRWMTRWETDLTTRDTNRIVRPLEWGFDWVEDFSGGGQIPGAKAQSNAAELMPGLKSRPISETKSSAGSSGVALVEEDGAGTGGVSAGSADQARMIALNEEIVRRSEEFYGYAVPRDFRIERRHPQLFPTNVRPETLAQEQEMLRQAASGELEEADFLRFTSPVRTRYPENDQGNARWYPAPEHKQPGRPKQAIIIMPQWNSDGISHNVF